MQNPEILYHYAPSTSRESILSLGLSVLFDKTGFDAIFLTDTQRFQAGMDCWEVNVKGLTDIELDQTGSNSSDEVWWLHDGSIAPSRIQLVTSDEALRGATPTERIFGMFAAATSQSNRPWKHIYGSRFQVDMCGATPVEIGLRILAESQTDCYFAWHDFAADKLAFVYASEELVRMCDPGGFEPAIARGEGQVVAVTISRLQV